MLLDIKVDPLTGKDMAQFLHQHLEDMRQVSPPESKHALDLRALQHPSIIVWSAWDGHQLVACGALKELTVTDAEIKSMRTKNEYRGKQVASTLLNHIINYAINKRYQRLSLETGSMDFFQPARLLYEKFGFTYCGPFAEYKRDPNSVFMTKYLHRGDRT